MRYKPLITAELHKGFSRDQGFIHLCERVKSWFKPSAFLNSWNSLFFFFLTFRPTKIAIKTVWWAAFFDICARQLLVKNSFRQEQSVSILSANFRTGTEKIPTLTTLDCFIFQESVYVQRIPCESKCCHKGDCHSVRQTPFALTFQSYSSIWEHWDGYWLIPRLLSIRHDWRYQKLKKTVAQRRSARSVFPWIPTRILSPAAQPAKVHLLKMRLRLKGTWTDFPVAWDLLPGCKCQKTNISLSRCGKVEWLSFLQLSPVLVRIPRQMEPPGGCCCVCVCLSLVRIKAMMCIIVSSIQFSLSWWDKRRRNEAAVAPGDKLREMCLVLPLSTPNHFLQA